MTTPEEKNPKTLKIGTDSDAFVTVETVTSSNTEKL